MKPEHLGDAQEVGRRKAAELRKKYPPYKIAPTPAIFRMDMFSRPLPAELLSTKAEANSLARQLLRDIGRWEDYIVVADPLYAATDWKDEKRRVYLIIDKDVNEYAGYLLIRKNAAGVGAPGLWKYDAAAFGPVWHSTRKGE
jgi:hypothetical protein